MAQPAMGPPHAVDTPRDHDSDSQNRAGKIRKSSGLSFNFSDVRDEPALSDCKLKLYFSSKKDSSDDVNGTIGSSDTGSGEPAGMGGHLADAAATSSNGEAKSLENKEGKTTTVASFGDTSMTENSEDPDVMIEIIPVTAIILSAKSAFFLKLFTGGFTETLSSSRDATVDIHLTSKEKIPFMSMLTFIYEGTIPACSISDINGLLDLLRIASRFGVDDCVTNVLLELEKKVAVKVSLSEACCILEAISLLQFSTPTVESVIEKATKWMVSAAGPLISGSTPSMELLTLPEARFMEIVQAHDLTVDSEDDVFYAVLVWCEHNHTKGEDAERWSLFCKFLKELRMPYVSTACISQLLDLDPPVLNSEVVGLLSDALYIKARQSDPPESILKPSSGLMKPWCFHKPRSCMESPSSFCIKLKLSLKDCREWSPKMRYTSSHHWFRGRLFSIMCMLNSLAKENNTRFGLYLMSNGVNCQVSVLAKVKSSGILSTLSLIQGNMLLNEGGRGFSDPFGEPWNSVVSNKKKYFSDGFLYLTVEICVKD